MTGWGRYGLGIALWGGLMVAAGPVLAQTMVPSQNGSCPSGASYAGSGYCRSSGKNFVPAQNGSCPSGASYAGAGYCASPAGVTFVPARNGSCPSGSSYAGAQYCKVR